MNKSALEVNTTEFLGPRLAALQRFAIGLGVVGLVLCVAGWVLDPTFYPNDPTPFFHAYLLGFLFWMGATGGSLILLMIHHVVGGGWGYIIRRFLEAATRLLPLMLLLFVPVIIGLLYFHLYSGTPASPGWYGPQAATIPAIGIKPTYLSLTTFLVRTGFYFIVWFILAYFLNQWGATQDREESVEVSARLNHLSAAGLVIYALTGSFAAFDWVMSLTPTWYSTIFGLLFLVCQVLTAMALMLFLFARLAGDRPLTQEVPRGYFRDLGNLLLTFIMLWGYISFSQYLLTFTGDSTDEISWYVTRAHHGWGFISLALIPIHFFLPFMVLLVGSGIKKNPIRLGWVAFYVLGMRLLDLWWWVTPTFRSHISLSISDVGAPLLLGGIWLWAWAAQVRGKPMVPAHDPRLEGHWQEVVDMADGHGWEHEVTPTTVYQGTQQEGIEHGHEDVDLDLFTVLKWFGAWALIVTISILVLWLLYNAWSNNSNREELSQVNPQFNQPLLPPEPRVLPNIIDSPPGSVEPMKGPAELERDYRRREDEALQRVGLEDQNGDPMLPPAAVAALTRARAKGALANGEMRLQPSEASGGTALENQLAGE